MPRPHLPSHAARVPGLVPSDPEPGNGVPRGRSRHVCPSPRRAWHLDPPRRVLGCHARQPARSAEPGLAGHENPLGIRPARRHGARSLGTHPHAQPRAGCARRHSGHPRRGPELPAGDSGQDRQAAAVPGRRPPRMGAASR
ncbi:hypothetical protein G6F40_016056 [Rhizopus arrhizus]|nr:hypothetical protein G6F40_016056 [Rhizopus arrhizus]